MSARPKTLAVGLASATLLLLLCGRAPLPSAVQSSAATASALLQGHLDVAGNFSTVVRDGHRYAAQPLGAALLWLPAATLFRALPTLDHPAAHALYSGLVAALFGGLLFALFYRRAHAACEALGNVALLATLCLGGTLVLVAGRQTDGVVAEALLLFLLVEAIENQRALWAGVGAGALLCFEWRAGLLVALAALAVASGPRSGWGVESARAIIGRAGRFMAGAIPLVALALWHALRAAPTVDPHAVDVWLALDGLLLSSGKSLFLYAPPLLLLGWAVPAAWRTSASRDTLIVRLVLCGALLVEVARGPDWHGDPSWGPMRLAALCPVLLVPVAAWLGTLYRRARTWPMLLATVGVAVQLLGCAVRPESYLALVTAEKDRTGAAGWFVVAPDQAHFIPQYSPLGGHLWVLRHLLTNDRHLDRDIPWVLITPAPAHLEDEWPTLSLDLMAVDNDRRVRALWAALVALGLASALTAAFLTRESGSSTWRKTTG